MVRGARREEPAGGRGSGERGRSTQDPEWTKLKADPAYADTVSNITNLILRPAAGSQI